MKALPWLLLALLALLAGYFLWWRPKVAAEKAAAEGGGSGGGFSSALSMTGGKGDYVRKFDNFGTEICPKIGEYLGAKIGGSAQTICNYSRVIDPTHYLHEGVAKIVDLF